MILPENTPNTFLDIKKKIIIFLIYPVIQIPANTVEKRKGRK